MKRQTGFTLVELVIVIAVLGILAGLAIPYFMEAREEAAKKECLANRTQILRMFHAQQAAGYSSDLTTFLTEAIEETDNKYFTFAPKCADGGEYGVSGDFVTCDFPGHNEDKNVAGSAAEYLYNIIKDAILNNKDLPKDWDNIGWRKYILGLLKPDINEADRKWDVVFVDGVSYNLTFHITDIEGASGIFPLIYLNNGTQWEAQYIYNGKTGKWYSGPTYNLAGSKDETIEKIIEKVTTKNGWKEVPDPLL